MQQFDLLINGFIDNNVGITDQFLSADLSANLQLYVRQLESENKMTNAGIGNDKIADKNQQMRGDKIFWLDKSHSNIYEQAFLKRVEAFIEHLNQTCYAGINDYEFHYAIYEAGKAYKKHKDQFKTDSRRKYSLVCYLNDDWVEADGGALRLYQNGDTQTITPNAQKAVFFKSDEMEHEVMLANRQRISITGWLKQN